MTYIKEILGRHHLVDFCDFVETIYISNFKIQLLLKSEFRKFTLLKLRDSLPLYYINTQFLLCRKE